jgi:DNA repair protein RadD
VIELRAYQLHDIERLRAAFAGGAKAICYQLPTGAGKTVVFADIIRRVVATGHRIAVLVHRRELVHQASHKLTIAGVEHGIIGANLDRNHDARVLIMAVQSAIRRLDRLPRIDFVVVDECAHSVSPTWTRVLGLWPEAWKLGTTATPSRLDGRGLGIEAGGPFDALVVGATIPELQAGGYLAQTRVFVPSRLIDTKGVRRLGGDFQADELEQVARVVTGDAVREYRAHADHQSAIAFGCTVAHAESVAAAFRTAGYRAGCAHGGLSMVERDALIQGLATGEVEVLTSCDLISEGLDTPSVGAVILLRPTQSLALSLQQIGRGMRPAPGKDHLTVLDHSGNCLTHGRPELERIWDLAGAPRGNGGQTPGWRCEDCGCFNHLKADVCEECGRARPVPKPTRVPPREVFGNLRELGPEAYAPAGSPGDLARLLRMPYRTFLSKPRTEQELRAYAVAHDYKPGWVWHRLQEQAEAAARKA